MNIGLFFGSFDPIHLGHVFIAKHKQIAQKTPLVIFQSQPTDAVGQKLVDARRILHDQDGLVLGEK